jgi:hypothetical protein
MSSSTRHTRLSELTSLVLACCNPGLAAWGMAENAALRRSVSCTVGTSFAVFIR